LTPGTVGCNTVPSMAIPQDYTTSTSTYLTSTSQPSIKDLSCNFENICSWKNSVSSFNWIVINGSTAANSFKGPSVDHTLNTDSGSLLTPNVTSNLASYSTANYLSPLMNGSKCIEFYYYMYGPVVSERISKTKKYELNLIEIFF
jgi:hypothetical protein